MMLNLRRALWLVAGALALALLTVIPLSLGTQVVATLAIACVWTFAWIATGRRSAGSSESVIRENAEALPSSGYRQAVILVCGDGLEGLFGEAPPGQLALRISKQGCYLRVPDLQQLPSMAESLMEVRPEWSGQLSVMFVVNPDEHVDSAVLAGRLRSFGYHVSLSRKLGLALPILLISYVQALRGHGSWFSWRAGQASPVVNEPDGCLSLRDWQHQSSEGATYGERLQACVKLNAIAAWLDEEVLPDFASREASTPDGFASSCAVTLVPGLPQAVAGSLWQQWLRDRTKVIGPVHTSDAAYAELPFPDALLETLPTCLRESNIRRAGVIALWLCALAWVIAMASSAWQNKLLVRQVIEDLKRYAAIPEPSSRAHPNFALREEAVAALRVSANRLDGYYRTGEPLALGFGLYRGEVLRPPLAAAIAAHRQPPADPGTATTPEAVRLDSLALFSSGSAQLRPGSTKVLVNALVNIKAQPGWLIVIAGHTDATGSPEHNLQLSRARAAAVRDWMQRMGDIPDSCFAVQGFGASQPIVSNDTEIGRTTNRRVDIRLIPEVGACVPLTAGSSRKTLSQPAAFYN